jgi:hypothetical protein
MLYYTTRGLAFPLQITTERHRTFPTPYPTPLNIAYTMLYARHLAMPMLYGAKRHSTRQDSSMPAHHQAVQCHYFAFRYATNAERINAMP